MTNAGKPASRRGARNDECWQTGLAQRGLRIKGDGGVDFRPVLVAGRSYGVAAQRGSSTDQRMTAHATRLTAALRAKAHPT